MDLPPFHPQFSRKQTQAWEQIHRANIDEMLYGGAKGGAKSVFLCFWEYLEAYEIARRYVPHALEYPIPIGWLGRKVAKHFKETTLDTWKRFIPPQYYQLKGDPPNIIIGQRVLIRTGGLDNTESLHKFNSAEFAFIGVDQAEETTRDDVGVLRATRRLVVNNHHIPGKIVYTANPADCWLKEDFIDTQLPGKVFVPALAKDNPWLPRSYIKVLEDSFSYRPDLLRAYLHGDWTHLSGIDQVFLAEWIAAARMRIKHESYIKRLVSVDPARFGDDLCVILGLENTRIAGACIMGQSTAQDIAAEAHVMSHRMGDCPVVVESVGTDATSDLLAEQGCRVIRYCPSDGSDNPDRWYNKRAQVWSTVARWFCDGVWDKQHGQLVTLPEPEHFDAGGEVSPLWEAWYNVTKQLTWPKYKFRGERVLVQPKDEIKEQHDGKSPDFADAYVNGIYHLPVVETVEVRERHKVKTQGHKSKVRM